MKIGLSVMSERIYRSKVIHEDECKTDKTQFHQSQTLFCLVEAFSNGGEEEMKCSGMRRDKDRRGEGVETGEGRCKILPFFILCVVERIAEVRARHFDG